MSNQKTATSSSTNLLLTAYPGDGAVLLGFNLDQSELKNHQLAGFAIQCIPPTGQPYYIQNRLNYVTPVSLSTKPVWTSSQDAPFQKFHWVHFPPQVVPGTFQYKVTARYCQGNELVDGPSAQVAVELVPQKAGNFELGLTRGYISSQAYAELFNNKDIRPTPKTLDYDTQPFQAQYEWLGYHARKMIFTLLQECVKDPSITVDLFAYDLDEPDIVKMLEALGPRLRAFLDNAPLHTKSGALEIDVHTRLVKSAGDQNIKQGHFTRFAHDKIIIQKKDGKAVKVLTGSANFSVRGLYVQANNVLLFNDSVIADQYEQVFNSVFNDMAAFIKSPLAKKWFDFPNQSGVPKFSVSFAPHPKPPMSMVTVDQALNQAKSSVLFAVMALSGGGNVIQTLKTLHLSGKIFSYGMTQNVDKNDNPTGVTIYRPGQPGILVPFSALVKQVPPPFNKETTGGMGQVIHDKFVVIDFNSDNPVVFTGSSNLADGGEASNGDNLLQITDPIVARTFAVEAIRLVDHYHFRAVVQQASALKPLQLSPCGAQPPWWTPDYDPQNMRNVQRLLFAGGPNAVTRVPSGVLPSVGIGNIPAPRAKKKAPKKSPRKKPGAPRKKAPAKKKSAKKKPTKKKAAKKKRAPAKKSKGSSKGSSRKKTAARKARPKARR